ncbi:hypothetical protein P863_24820 [Mycobacterium avium subsp. silvaticum ATCC 49884]|nr:hypothetical protein P863_24820 [Mycobacterium avium subsp. silvaticum ATCC 49884]
MSQVRALDTKYLTRAADFWSRSASLWEQTFTEINDRMLAPRGVAWKGQAAVAAQARAYRDVISVRAVADQLHQAAAIALRGDEQLQACREGVLDAVVAAESDGFDVGEEYSVADRSKGGPANFRSSRQALAEEHASFIRHRLAALIATDQQLASKIAATTKCVDTLTFEGSSGRGDTIAGDNTDHGIQLVDNKTRKDSPQPVPPDPQPGPLPPVNNGDDVRNILDPLQNGGKRGRYGVGTNPGVKELWDRSSIKRMWDYLTRNAADSPGRPGYDGVTRVLPDGTEIGLRQSGKGWGDTIDVWYPDGSDKKLHVPYAPPVINSPPQIPAVGQPVPLPGSPPQVGGPPPVAFPPTQVVDPARLPPWLQDPSPPGFHVTPATPLPIAPLDTPDTPTLAPSATPGLASSSGGASPLSDFAHDLADAGKKAGEGLLAGIVILGSILAGGASPGGQFAR